MSYQLTGSILDTYPNKYKLVILASQRARQLNMGAHRLIDTKLRKETNVALMEVLLGKVKTLEGGEDQVEALPGPKSEE